MLEIYNLDESMAMLALKRKLYASYFTYLLDMTFSKSYLKILVCV